MRYLYVLWVISTFVVCFLLLFPIFLVLSFLGIKGRRAIWAVLRGWSYCWFFVIGMPVRAEYGAKPDKRKNYIVVANHASYIDTPFLFRAVPFFVRPLAKKELSKIPLFGRLYKSMAVLVDRDSVASKRASIHALRRSLQREGSIFIFPEGTFNETPEPLKGFYDGAFRIALRTRTPILPVIFPDTVKRWHHSSLWRMQPGTLRVIFLPEVPVDGYGANDIQAYKQKVFDAMWQAMAKAKGLDGNQGTVRV
ncbi:MAG: lysophospholipid acyltransferase family protein [Edaphocola sp.]